MIYRWKGKGKSSQDLAQWSEYQLPALRDEDLALRLAIISQVGALLGSVYSSPKQTGNSSEGKQKPGVSCLGLIENKWKAGVGPGPDGQVFAVLLHLVNPIVSPLFQS